MVIRVEDLLGKESQKKTELYDILCHLQELTVYEEMYLYRVVHWFLFSGT